MAERCVMLSFRSFVRRSLAQTWSQRLTKRTQVDNSSRKLNLALPCCGTGSMRDLALVPSVLNDSERLLAVRIFDNITSRDRRIQFQGFVGAFNKKKIRSYLAGNHTSILEQLKIRSQCSQRSLPAHPYLQRLITPFPKAWCPYRKGLSVLKPHTAQAIASFVE